MSNDRSPQKDPGKRAEADEPTAKLENALGITNQALEVLDPATPGHSAAVDALQSLEVAAERRKDDLDNS